MVVPMACLVPWSVCSQRQPIRIVGLQYHHTIVPNIGQIPGKCFLSRNVVNQATGKRFDEIMLFADCAEQALTLSDLRL